MARYGFTHVGANISPSDSSPRVCDVQERGRTASGRYLEIEIAGTRHTALVLREGNPCLVLVNQRPIEVVETQGRYSIVRGGPTFEESHTRNTRHSANPASTGTVLAPMPGKVVRILCQLGNIVEVGAPLVVLEAMKMENELRAARPGVIKAIFVSEGQAVESRARLVELG